MKVLVDMNLSPYWAKYLTEAGFIAAHWSSLGPITAPDVEIMARAKTDGYVVLTCDLDFGTALAFTHEDKPSVMQLRVMEVLPEEIGSTVIEALRQAKAELEEGALLTVDGPYRVRLQRLPLGMHQ